LPLACRFVTVHCFLLPLLLLLLLLLLLSPMA
jgi:hypothetical protein